jgi:hypothetical protein
MTMLSLDSQAKRGARGRRSAVCLLTGAALIWGGCSSLCIDGTVNPEATCQASGAAMLSAPAGFTPAAPPHVLRAAGCLDSAGQCTANPSFTVSTRADADGGFATPGAPGGLVVSVALSPQVAAGTIELPSPEIDVSGDLDLPESYEPLTLVSGAVTVLSSDTTGLHATFELTVATASGETFTLTGGTVDATCQVVQRCG